MAELGKSYRPSQGGLPCFIVRHRIAITVVWLCVGAILLPLAPQLQDRLADANNLQVGESARVAEILAVEFAADSAQGAWLVVSGVPNIKDPEGTEALREIIRAIRKIPSVSRVESYFEFNDPLLISANGDGALVFVQFEGTQNLDGVISSLRATTEGVKKRLRDAFPDLGIYWTGNVVLNHDILRTSSRDVRQAEIRALPLTFALLLWAFGAFVAASCPVVVGGLAITLTLGVVTALSVFWQPSMLVQSIVSLLGLALGIDYALVIVTRFREQLAAGLDPEQAAEETIRRAGAVVLLSGASVAIGFAALLAVPIDELRSIAIGGLLVTSFAVALATTLLPALLTWIGPRLDLGRFPLFRRRKDNLERWRRWGRWVTNHPWLVLLITGVPIVLLAYPASQLRIAFPSEGGWLPRAAESVQGIQKLKEMGRSGVIYQTSILFQLPDGIGALDQEGWAMLHRLQDHLEADNRITSIYSLPAFVEEYMPAPLIKVLLPDRIRARFLNERYSRALFIVIPREELTPHELLEMVHDLRVIDTGALTAGAGGQLLVGGLAAATLDHQRVVADWFPTVILLVVMGTFVVLLVGFRSLVIPIKAIALNLLSVAAAFGVVVLVFFNGYGAEIFGLSSPIDGMFPTIPIIVFCTVFGISMDYEVFLLARVAEARSTAGSEAEAITRGLAHTAGMITSAAAIMIIVFGAFALGTFLPIQILGLALAVAVLIDAMLIRVALGPALLTLAGKWNWWPGDQLPGRYVAGAAMNNTDIWNRERAYVDPGEGP